MDYGRNDFQHDRDVVAREAPKTIWMAFTHVVLPIFLLSLFIGGITWAVRIAGAPAGVLERVVDPDNAIYNVEWFRTQFNQIQATKSQIVVAQEQYDTFVKLSDPLTPYTYEQRQEYVRLSTNLTGLKQFCFTQVAEYNAHAGMLTRGLYKGNDLPAKMDCQ